MRSNEKERIRPVPETVSFPFYKSERRRPWCCELESTFISSRQVLQGLTRALLIIGTSSMLVVDHVSVEHVAARSSWREVTGSSLPLAFSLATMTNGRRFTSSVKEVS